MDNNQSFTFKKDKKILIGANYNYFPFLFSYKNTHPELDIKFITLNELKDKLSFTYLKDPLPYLIKEKRIEYNKAKKYAQLLKASGRNNNPTLKTLYLELIENGYIPIEKDSLDLYELNLYNIYLFEDDEDEEIKGLLSSNHLSYDYLHFEDLSFKESSFFLNPEIKIFNNKFSQFFYLFASIRNELVSHPEKKDKIGVLINDESDLYYITYFSSLFDIEVMTNISIPFNSIKPIAEKINWIYQNKSFDFSSEEMNIEELKMLNDIIYQYGLRDIDDFAFAYVNLLEIAKSKNINQATSSKGLMFFNSFNFDENEVYITNFMDDVFFHIYKDNNVLIDAELEKIGANTSYMLTKLDKRMKSNYLKYMNISFLSRVEQHLNDNIYDSPFIDEFNWHQYVKNISDINVGLLTPQAYEIYKAHVFDEASYYKKDQLTRSYDHHYKHFDDASKLFENKNLSVSQIKEYVSCPFKYYLSHLIEQNIDEKHAAWKGTLIHSVLEDIYLDNYDYDEAFEKGKKAYYKEMEKANYKYDNREKVYLDIVYYWLYPIAMMIRKEKSEMKFVSILKKDYEVPVKYNIYGHLFKGSVDKVIFTDADIGSEQPTNTKKFYTIIDYKSGSHGSSNFDPAVAPTGYDIQLPLYYYALEIKEHYSSKYNASFGGMGIRHVYGSTIKDAFYKDGVLNEDILMKNLQIKGLFINNADFYTSLSKENINDKGEIKGNRVIDSSYTYSLDESNNHPFKLKYKEGEIDYSLEMMIDDVIESVETNINNILNGKFDISPIILDILNNKDEKLTCSYCPYRDVCYRDLSDARDLKKETIMKKFFSVKEEENNDA